MARKGDWMQTVSGRQFWPLDPRPAEVSIKDIAHSLAMQCRYGGHCNTFYSVAEHSVHVSKLVPQKDALWGLLHDAAEAYVSDVVRPLKPFLTNYRDIESHVQDIICERFGLDYTMPESVKAADIAMLTTERDQIMNKSPAPWHVDGEPLPLGPDVVILKLGWRDARTAFLSRFTDLYHGR